MTGPGRLADERVPHARRPAVLRRDVLPGHAAPRDAVVPPGARGRARGVDDAAGRARGGRRRGSSQALAEQQGGAAGRRARRCRGREVLATAADGDRGRSSTRVNGGWGRAPKFPQPMTIEVLLRRHVGVGRRAAARRSRGASLDAMAAGGIHDQLGGGFHRYATDAAWLVPALRADALRQRPARARVRARVGAHRRPAPTRDGDGGVLDYLLRELRTPDGGFAASQDADTEGEEGATFVWSAAEVRRGPGRRRARAVRRRVRGDRRAATGRGTTILSRVRGDAELAERFGLAAEVVASRLAEARASLLARRGGRPQPARDDKVLAAWNGLAIAALADASRALGASGEPAVAAAAGALSRGGRGRGRDAVLAGLLGARRPAPPLVEGRPRDGRRRARGPREPRRRAARAVRGDLRRALVSRGRPARRRRSSSGSPTRPAGSSTRPTTASALVVRPKDVQDNATPSGGAMATTVLLRLAALTGEGRYRTAAERALAAVGPYLVRYPTAFAQWLCALELAHAGIVGGRDRRRSRTIRRRAPLRRRRRPRRTGRSAVLAVDRRTRRRRRCRCSRGRFALDGRPTAFVCRDFACRQPVTEPEALDALLAGG